MISWCQVEWKTSIKKIADKTYEICLKAEIAESWHIYSLNTPKGGPLPTAITYGNNPLIQIIEKAKEKGNIQIKYEGIFGIDVMYYEDKVEFVQLVKLKANAKTNVTGSIEYMICNDHQCKPPTIEKFDIKIE